jgi:hypothetical protein
MSINLAEVPLRQETEASNGAIDPATTSKQRPPLQGAAEKLFSREYRGPLTPLTQEEIRTLHNKIKVPLDNPDNSSSSINLAKAVVPSTQQRFEIDYLNTNSKTSAQG